MLDSNDLDSVKMSAKLKIKSASVEDLGHIVKKMIDGVLEDTDQAAKLHQAVFEEYYSKKMEEFREVKAKIEADRKLDKKAEKPEPEIRIQRSNFEVGDTEPKNIDDVTPEDGPPSSTSEKIYDEADIPVVHVVRRAKYVRVSEAIHVPDTYLGLAVHHTAMDLVQNPKETVTPLAESKEQIEPERNFAGDVELVEWWRSSTLNKVTSEDKIQALKPIREIPVQFKSKGQIAFENWKKVKTDTYHRVLREEQERRRQDQAAKARENEKKQAATEAYLSWKRQQRLRRTTPRLEEPQRISSREKRRVNSEAFRTWKRQKDAKFRDRRMYRQTAQPQVPKTGLHVAFDAWCNQLDSVLHQKYLRERRYLVHSFYCQPTYFGSAALWGR